MGKKNLKTTLVGVLMIVGSALGFIANWLASGVAPDPEHWAALGAAVTAGAGFIAAADGKKAE